LWASGCTTRIFGFTGKHARRSSGRCWITPSWCLLSCRTVQSFVTLAGFCELQHTANQRPSLCLSLTASHGVCHSLPLTVSLTLCLSLCLCHTASHCVSHSLPLIVCLSHCLSLCLSSVPLSISHSLPLTVFLTYCLPLCLSLVDSHCVSQSLPLTVSL
jgi:hypothetical protein